LLKADLLSFINYGTKRNKGNNIISMLYLLLYNEEYRSIFLLRQNLLVKKLLGILCRPLTSLSIITKSSKIKKGFLVVHGISTIINAEEIGENCTIYQQCSIGYGKGGKPIIGNNVTIYAGAIIIGNITIGNNCTIGAGTVINKSIPDNSTCVGSGFRIIS
jgi:serine O-acetyltransferase